MNDNRAIDGITLGMIVRVARHGKRVSGLAKAFYLENLKRQLDPFSPAIRSRGAKKKNASIRNKAAIVKR